MSTHSDLGIRTIATPGLGDRSYVVIHEGWAVAIDVQRDIARIEDLLRDERAQLGAVLETHLHNDYLTGGLALSRRHGAEYVVPAGPRLGYSATRAVDGLPITVGALTLRTIDSPGHTDAHSAYALSIEGGPVTHAFTGGSLLLGATGRSDLLGTDLAEGLARKQYWSVRRMARLLGGSARIMPTHGFGSFCVAGSPTPSGETVDEQLSVNPAYLLSEEDFIVESLARCGAYPKYYAFMGPRNAGGVLNNEAPVPEVGAAVVLDAEDNGVLVVDIRPRAEWAADHVRGSVSVDASGALATWLGWVAPIDRRVVLLAESREAGDDAVTELRRIGFDEIVGVHVATRLDHLPDGNRTSTQRVDFIDLAAELDDGARPVVIDTREDNEWRQGHVAGSIHVAAHAIEAAFADALPLTTPWLYCGAGFRAAIAASILERLGGSAVVIDDAVSRAEQVDVPWCSGEGCSDNLCTRDVAATVSAPMPSL
jgi:glyoxylase-like metal-dependent hydrolase (beta-lactamase superfamily II)/rhodanese-related sulfurtransferase